MNLDESLKEIIKFQDLNTVLHFYIPHYVVQHKIQRFIQNYVSEEHFYIERVTRLWCILTEANHSHPFIKTL